MDHEAVFAASARERRGVADLLEGLDERSLATPSLCGGWDVRTVGGHLAVAAAPSKAPFVLAVLRSAGNLHRANDLVARAAGRHEVSALVASLRRNAASRFAPPLVGPRAPLTDLLVHGGDIRVPLGLAHEPDGSAVTTALQFLTHGRPVGFVSRGRLAGLRLSATDLDWSHGRGAELAGRGIDLLMAACGRSAVLPRLTGAGVDILRSRLAR